MKSSRDQVLADLRTNAPPPTPLPELAGDWIAYDDPLAQFTAVLEGIGGRVRVVHGDEELRAAVAEVQQQVAAANTLSVAPAAPGNVDPASLSDPHDLADIDLAVLTGDFAVAENGAVWVTDRQLPLRIAYFICQHLVLIVPAAAVVPTMHAAYDRLAAMHDGEGEFATPAFGCFVSGPSKTADIEQSLVIGAHGARSLTVLFTG
ncbi:MAG: hypothetical protein CMJ58_23140 [Planctomycetaceae bacterium]|nr:hypothetical protein [Planctomycetaceae bacterium]